MSGIGPDIAEVINELGVNATVFRYLLNSPIGSGSTTSMDCVLSFNEKIVYDVNGQASNVFMREHYVAASFVHNTKIMVGDIIGFHGSFYLVVHKSPDDFENFIVEFASGLLKCNSHFVVRRSFSVTNQTTFEVLSGWVDVAAGYGLIYKGTRRSVLNEEVAMGLDNLFEIQCFVPKSYGVLRNDLIYISPTVAFRVRDVEPFSYPGVDVAILIEEAR